MKKLNLILFGILLLFFSGKLMSQVTPGGVFDKVYDRFGNQLDMANLRLGSAKNIGGTATLSAVPSQTCSAGYFNVYFAPGSYWTLNAATQTVLCQLLTDMSNFISSPLSVSGNTVKINIYCDDVDPTAASNGVLGTASPFLVTLASPNNPNQGIVDNQIYKAIVSGQDPFIGLAIPVAGNAGFYSGYINISPIIGWNLSTSTSTYSSGDSDFYTVFLHEITHALGFMSLIDQTGFSKYGQATNVFSRFDLSLTHASGTSFLTNTLSPGCSASNLSFQGSTLSISQGVCPGTSGTCSLLPRYISSNVNVPLFAPECYSSGSSLSHFSDLCYTPPGYSNTCSAIASPNNSFNYVYFVMSAGQYPGNCGVKRFLKEEERYVLCDLGYSVSGTYSSPVAAASHTYGSGSSCTGTDVWGAIDGFINSSYTYTSAVGATTLAIPITGSLGILANDAAAATTISCVEVLYNNVTAAVSGTNIVLTAGTGVSGFTMIKYYPVSSGGVIGNVTYVYAYFLPGNCNPPNACNMVQNGDFESLECGAACGNMFAVPCNTSTPKLSCWDAYAGSPDVFTRNCTSGSNYNLGSSTFNILPALDSFNGSPNDRIVAISNGELLVNNLSSPLTPGQAYQISLYAYNTSYNSFLFPMNVSQGPLVVTIASVPNVATFGLFPASMTILSSFTLNTVNAWSSLTQTFVFSPTVSASHNAIVVGIDYFGSIAVNSSIATATTNTYVFFDEVSLMPLPTPTFSIPDATFCGNASLTNLAQYIPPIPGTFSGTGISTATVGGIVQYNFNASATLTPGAYPIAFTYTTSGGCVNTLYQSINLQPSTAVTVTTSVSVPLYCSNGNGAVITATGSASGNYVWQPGSLYGATQTVSPLSTTVYTVSLFTSSCTAQQTATLNVAAPPTLTLSGVSTNSSCPGGYVTLSATGSFTSITWQPGGYTTSTVIATPTTSTIYTATALSQCSTVATVTAQVTNSLSPPGSLSLTSVTYTGSNFFNDNLFVPAGVSATLSGDFVMAPGVEITVQSGGTLNIVHAHLYTCQTAMWQGIVIDNGGMLNASGHNLIEDAVFAISVSNHTTSTLTNILNITNTIFNKNHVDIYFKNYPRTSTSFSTALAISKCVFTCRELAFTSTVWPTCDLSSTLGGTGAELRSVTSPTSGLTSPYLGQSGLTPATLKSPYAGQNSQFAIYLYEVGITSGSNFYDVTIGDQSDPDLFNLFDTHDVFIYAQNSNVNAFNNVFQNQVNGTVLSPVLLTSYGPSLAITYYQQTVKTSAIMDYVVGTSSLVPSMRNVLNLTATQKNVGNRFWNCYSAIDGHDVYRLIVDKATFRSAQTPTDAPLYRPGNKAITANTCRVQYFFRYNEFTNISNCINIPLAAGTYTNYGLGQGLLTAIYQSNLSVIGNTFSPGSDSSSFLGQAVHITCPNNVPVVNATETSGGTTGAIIEYNTLDRVFRGIYVQGINGFRTHIRNNTVSLAEDNVFNSAQHGIDVSNSMSAANQGGEIKVTANTLYGYGSSPQGNTKASLIYGSGNTALISPSITCNEVSNSYQGFAFSGINAPNAALTGLVWLSNDMTSLQRGMVLKDTAVIGQQGDTITATGNSWLGTWSSTVNGTYSDHSQANYSSLYVSSTSTLDPSFPPNNNGDPFGTCYANTGIISSSGGGYYNCSEPSHIVLNPGGIDYGSDNQNYIATCNTYRFLYYNDSLLRLFEDYYAGIETTAPNIKTLLNAEEALYAGDYAGARTLVSTVTPVNGIESNYINFYTLYANYQEAVYEQLFFTQDDSTALYALSSLCPEVNGACIYQSRALYNSIYSTIVNYTDNCAEAGKEKTLPATPHAALLKPTGQEPGWAVQLYPNPAATLVNIVSTEQQAPLNIVVTDVTGRIVLHQQVKTNNFIATLELELINGAYMATITTANHAPLTKKLLIAR